MNPQSIQTEVDASFLYQKLAEQEQDPKVAEIFKEMSQIEQGHAEIFAKKEGFPLDQVEPSWRAKLLNRIGKIFGYQYVFGALMDTEKSIANAVIATKKKERMKVTGTEANHVNILESILQHQKKLTGKQVVQLEGYHRSVGGNAIRAAVLGGNDGLVSNFGLIMGVAGAASSNSAVVLAGVAGLLAGGLSMALGEWISVKSSQELYENQMKIEMEELENNPEGEKKELILMYRAKGFSEKETEKIVNELMKDKDRLYQALVKEELGIDPEELKGSAMEAALYSFFLFSIGAVIPLLPFLFASGQKGILISIILSALGLFLIGAAITLFTGKNVWFSGFRQMLFGLVAAAITFGIGKWIGVAVLG